MAAPASAVRFGVDIGGSGVKGAPVDVADATLTAPRHRIETPKKPTPDSLADVVAEVVGHFDWKGSVGCTFPGVVRAGVVRTAVNLHDSWVGVDAAGLLADRLGQRVMVMNDADLAGLAEVRYGAGRAHDGVVVMVTFGTGIGTAVFNDGVLVPNTEFGHIELDGDEAEAQASDRAREQDDLSWKQWAKRVTAYLRRLEDLLWPDLFIVGGGVSKQADKFLPLVDIRTPVEPAQLRNDAGIVGAALVAP